LVVGRVLSVLAIKAVALKVYAVDNAKIEVLLIFKTYYAQARLRLQT
jgi:hypothetical protein